jgi:hypothetical protein
MAHVPIPSQCHAAKPLITATGCWLQPALLVSLIWCFFSLGGMHKQSDVVLTCCAMITTCLKSVVPCCPHIWTDVLIALASSILVIAWWVSADQLPWKSVAQGVLGRASKHRNWIIQLNHFDSPTLVTQLYSVHGGSFWGSPHKSYQLMPLPSAFQTPRVVPRPSDSGVSGFRMKS